MPLLSALWRRLDLSDGLVHGSVSEIDPGPGHPDGALVLDGAAVVHDADGVWSSRHSVVVDRRWRTTAAFVEVLGADGLDRVTLEADPLGEWTLDGRPWPDLSGCVDVDVSVTPLTNLLPVRRLGLAVGQETTTDAAWLDLPSLAVHRVRQTYRRLPDDPQGRARYRYADATYGPYAVTVDDDGLVVVYQGLFARAA